MSRYGPPPGGPYEPYPEYPDRSGYGSPSDPWHQQSWGDERYWDDRPPPGYPEPGYPPPGYGRPPPGYGGPPPGYDERGGPEPPYPDPYSEPPPRRYREVLRSHGGDPLWDDLPGMRPRRNVGLYATVAVLVVLAAVGVGYALYVLSGDSGGGNPVAADPTSPPSPAGSAPASPGPTGTPADNLGLSAAVAQVDDCLVNDGSVEATQMRIVRCDEEQPDDTVVYQVLAVVNEAVEGDSEGARHDSAQTICADTEGYTHHYFEVGDDSSFVLCMAEAG